jgi:heme-degrading monooxygenase HmoA
MCETCPMITEHALLPVISGQEEQFEAAFDRARAIIASMPGFISLSLSRSVESPSTYLLLVQWESLEDHTLGFRGSPQYQQWRELLHKFYEPFPLVEHYELVNSAQPVLAER